jgi:hypothetical protein
MTVFKSVTSLENNMRLVSKTTGQLGAGNFSHYSLTDRGTFKLVLVSEQGDADLYVSDKHARVDFSNYDYQSITYGEDYVFVKDDMTRPVYISVYAHPYHYQTVFTLYQYEIDTRQRSHINEFTVFNDNAYFDAANDEFSRIDSEKNAREQTYAEHYTFHNDRDQDHFKERKSGHGDHGAGQPSKKSSGSGKSPWANDDDDDNGGSEYKESFFFKLLLHLLEFVADILL